MDHKQRQYIFRQNGVVKNLCNLRQTMDTISESKPGRVIEKKPFENKTQVLVYVR